MNMICASVLFLSLFAVSYSAVFFELQKSPNSTCSHKEQHYIVGESWSGEGCSKVTCEAGHTKDTVVLEYYTCGKSEVIMTPNCTVRYNGNLPYPHCCEPVIKCHNHE